MIEKANPDMDATRRGIDPRGVVPAPLCDPRGVVPATLCNLTNIAAAKTAYLQAAFAIGLPPAAVGRLGDQS